MPPKTRYKAVLDHSIPYRALWTAFALGFAVLVASGIIWIRLRPPGDDDQARREIQVAERLKARADVCVTSDLRPEQQSLLGDAATMLEAARLALARKEFVPARTSARVARDRLSEFVDHVCAARDAVAELVPLEGDVKVKKMQSPRWIEARRQTLAVGDRVRTDMGVAEIVYKASGEIQQLLPGTVVEIRAVIESPEGKPGVSLNVEHGRTSVKGVPNSPTVIQAQDVKVQPNGDLVEIESAEGGDKVSVTSRLGGAGVEKGGTKTTMARETRVDSQVGSPLGTPKRALGRPELQEPMDGRVFSKGEDTRITFTWRPMANVKGYVWEIARNPHFVPVLNEGADERWPSPKVELDAPIPDTYYWRAAAIDEDGVYGEWSEVRRFRVHGADTFVPDYPPPTLELTEMPIELGNRVILSGRTEPNVSVEVLLNGSKYADLTVDEKGAFQTIATLHEGRNEIELVARDAYGREARKKVIVHFTP